MGKTIFCDFDGPIVDVSDRYYSTYQQGLAHVQAVYASQEQSLPLHVLTKHQFWQMKQERTPDPEIAMRSGLQGQQIDLFLQQVKQMVNHPELLQQDQLQPGVKQALTQLYVEGVQLVLVTLRCQQQVRQLLRQYGIAHLFSQIHGATDEQAAYLNQAEHKTQLLAAAMTATSIEPHPEPYTPDRAGSTHAWMIGDTEADILAGQAVGISTIALTCGIRSQAYLQRFAPCQIHTDLATAVTSLLKTDRHNCLPKHVAA
ncbi:HAD family hydrolase [Thermocoleostomius sinensis]|uniref:HAD hydrolase-like protein n=1 Tax=Thermocoleostomius sinensis A174 TaxID=2016057 RepID=A0A9E9C6Y9_9CYAN|nr:HAD hydrolase-like protein [Thermocoleostomius sinensis]WAL62776.1 HAD hydrolase-like protein [Thermocoleostomius sinensis A174]